MFDCKFLIHLTQTENPANCFYDLGNSQAMQEIYRPELKAHVLTDVSNRVRAIRHSQEYWESPTGGG